MLRSMNSAITGLRIHQMFMDVIGNNIANVNTNAFKSGRISFQNMLTSTIRSAVAPTELRGGINSVQIGMGASVAGVEQVNTQGGFNTTSKVTDMAIQGDGFFVVTDGFQNFYTRDGSFDLDQNGMLISPNTGLRVSGWLADNGVINASTPPAGGITIPLGQAVAAKKSSAIEFNGNLNGAPTQTFLSGVVEASTEFGGGNLPQNGIQTDHGDTISFTFDGVTYTTPISDQPAGTVANSGNGGLGKHDINGPLNTTGNRAALAADMEYAMNQALVDAGYRYEDGSLYTFPTGTNWGGAAGERSPLIQVQVVDDGGTTGGEAKLQFVAQKGLSFANAPSNNLALSSVLRNRGADNLEKINSTMQVYDTLGNAHDVNITFEKVLEIEDPSNSTNVMVASPDTWKWYVTGTEVDAAGTDPTTGLPLGAGWGFVKFDATGGFRSVETRRSNPLAPAGFNPLGVNKSFIDQASKAVVMFDWNNGAGDNQIVQLDFSRMTELQDGNTVAESKNDGFATGTLTSFTIGADGVILGQYSNGKTNPLAQVALATFPNVGGLTQIGSNMFVESANSGFAQIGEPRSGNRGSINAGQIEMSNVDLAQQFTDMIKAQRGFQANSRIITTSDEMLQDLVNLKR